MKILWLGYEKNPCIDFLRRQGEEIVTRQDKVTPETIQQINPEQIISYGYRHIIGSDIIEQKIIHSYPNILNLHISLLPWNRGADPNFWSWLEHTPKGYTIMRLDIGIDTGDILLQKQAQFRPNETLASSYQRLREGIEALFIGNWPEIRDGEIKFDPQTSKGTAHKVKDLDKYRFLMQEKSWDTPVREIEEYGRKNDLWVPQNEQ